MKLIFTFLVLFFFLVSCSAPDNRAAEKTAAHELPDSLFPVKNISSTMIEENDKVKYHHLDSAEKMDLVAPVFLKDYEINSDYFIHWQTALLISRQDKIGAFTPIVVSIGGDDFDAVYYILLDERQKAVSGFQIGGSGICGGPIEVSDSMLIVCPVRTSTFNKDLISTSVVRMTFHPDSVKHPTLVDSVVYSSKVLPDGRIETTLKDSTRMQRIIY